MVEQDFPIETESKMGGGICCELIRLQRANALHRRASARRMHRLSQAKVQAAPCGKPHVALAWVVLAWVVLGWVELVRVTLIWDDCGRVAGAYRRFHR